MALVGRAKSGTRIGTMVLGGALSVALVTGLCPSQSVAVPQVLAVPQVVTVPQVAAVPQVVAVPMDGPEGEVALWEPLPSEVVKALEAQGVWVYQDKGVITGRGEVVGELSLKGANFKGWTLENFSFHETDLSGANFEDAHLKEIGMEGVNLLGARFTRATITGAPHHKFKLEDMEKFERGGSATTEWTRTNVRGANFDGARVSEMRLQNLEFTRPDAWVVISNGRRVPAEGEGLASARGLKVTKSVLSATTLAELIRAEAKQLPGNTITYHGATNEGLSTIGGVAGEVRNVDFSGTAWPRDELKNVKFIDCDLTENTMRDIQVENVQLLGTTRISRSEIRLAEGSKELRIEKGVSAVDVNFEGTHCTNCEIAGDLSGASLNRTNLTGSKLTGVVANVPQDGHAEYALSATNAVLDGVEFPAKMNRWNLASSSLHDAKIPEAAKVRDSNFSQAKMGGQGEARPVKIGPRADFSRSVFSDAELGETTWDSVVFDGAVLTNTILVNGRFVGDVSFRGAHVESVDFTGAVSTGGEVSFFKAIINAIRNWWRGGSISLAGSEIKGEFNLTQFTDVGELVWKGVTLHPRAEVIFRTEEDALAALEKMSKVNVTGMESITVKVSEQGSSGVAQRVVFSNGLFEAERRQFQQAEQQLQLKIKDAEVALAKRQSELDTELARRGEMQRTEEHYSELSSKYKKIAATVEYLMEPMAKEVRALQKQWFAALGKDPAQAEELLRQLNEKQQAFEEERQKLIRENGWTEQLVTMEQQLSGKNPKDMVRLMELINSQSEKVEQARFEHQQQAEALSALRRQLELQEQSRRQLEQQAGERRELQRRINEQQRIEREARQELLRQQRQTQEQQRQQQELLRKQQQEAQRRK